MYLQLITTLPIKKLPKSLSVGREVREKDLQAQAAISAHDGPSRPGESRPSRGQILWIRSISRLQQQVSTAVCLFMASIGLLASVSELSHLHSVCLRRVQFFDFKYTVICERVSIQLY